MLLTFCKYTLVHCYFNNSCLKITYNLLQEYEELANKIHELQTQLQTKEQLLTDIEIAPPDPPPIEEPPEPKYPAPINLAPVGNGAKVDTASGTDQGALASPSLPLKSPLGHVKAFLPNSQHTSVSEPDKLHIIEIDVMRSRNTKANYI